MKNDTLFLYNKTMRITVIKKPISDEVMVFNEMSGRYELTMQYVKDNFTITFANDKILEERIKKTTRKIYNVIYARSNTANKGVIDFMLHRTQQGRVFIHDLLYEQIEADLQTGYNDISSMPAINYAKGQVIPREEQIRNQISVDTEQILDRSEEYFGINIMYASVFPFYVYNFVEKNK